VAETVEIFVSLIGEGVDVWRPVRAEHVHGNVFKIVDQPYDREIENWQFEPGDEVVCKQTESSDGLFFAIAIR
jgi:hypothetical protein